MKFLLKRGMGRSMGSLAGVLCMLAIVFSSCYHDYGLEVEDYDVVATFYDRDFDFSSVQKYSMPDSVMHFVDEGDVKQINREYDEFILSQVAMNLEALGYEVEQNPEQNPPDVVILVGVTSSETYVAYTSYPWYDYWGWYPGWGYWGGWGPGYGMYYPYYGYTSVSSYSTGTLLIDMVDRGARDEGEELIPSVWAGAVNGLLEGSSTEIRRRLTSSINQCFSQSPYLYK